jgi:hypothetical protein
MTTLPETAPPQETLVAVSTRVVSQKFIEEQPQVLRLILAPNHPSDEDLSPGTPVRAKIRSATVCLCQGAEAVGGRRRASFFRHGRSFLPM